MQPSLTNRWRIVILCALVIGLVHPIATHWSLFSGDAEIHLVYARNLLRGHPLQFNLNEPNSGETSMGYMFIVALIMRIAGAAATPLIMNLLCLACFYGTAAATYLIGGRAGLHSPWREIAAVLVLWLPGSAYSAMYGTENVYFAALTGFYVYAAMRMHWFDGEEPASLRSDILMSLCAGGLFWIRPEAAPCMAILLLARTAAAFAFQRDWKREAGRVALCGILFALAIAGYFMIFRHYSGDLPYGAGVARRLISLNVDCIRIFGVAIDTKVLLRLASYFPIVVSAIWTGFLALRATTFDLKKRFQVLIFFSMFFLFMGAYVLAVLPTVHFARYSVFLWPFGMILALLGLQAISEKNWLSPAGRGVLFALLFVSFVGTISYETYLRRRMNELPDGVFGLVHVEEVPAHRKEYSEKLAEELHLPPGAPAVLAYQEVQARYEIDDNFKVASLDGITDSRLLRYFCDGWIDHDGYVIDARVDYLMELPNYNSDKRRWSLAELKPLQVGESVTRPGVIYTKVGPGEVVHVQRTVDAAADRPGGTCAKDTKTVGEARKGSTATQLADLH